MLYITINDKNQQVYFYQKRGGVDKGSYRVSFQIPASLMEEIKANAVPQKQMENFPGRLSNIRSIKVRICVMDCQKSI